MKTNRRIIILLIIGLLVIVGGAIAGASGDRADNLSIPWWTVDGGGGDSSGGAYTLRGTTGQPDAGRASGGDFSLVGGFWRSPEARVIELFMPVVTR